MKNVKGGETQVLLTPPTGRSLQQQRTYIGQSRGNAGPSHTSYILIWANIRPFIIFCLFTASRFISRSKQMLLREFN